MPKGEDAGFRTRAVCSATVVVDRHCQETIGVNDECAPIDVVARTMRADRVVVVTIDAGAG